MLTQKKLKTPTPRMSTPKIPIQKILIQKMSKVMKMSSKPRTKPKRAKKLRT